MNNHIERVASARASSKGWISFREATGGGLGIGACAALPSRRLMYGLGGGT